MKKSSAYFLTVDSCKEMKYLPKFEYFIGWHQTLIFRYMLPNTWETVYDMKDGFVDGFFDGIDPEWETMELYKKWESIKPFTEDECKKYKSKMLKN